MNVAAGKRAVRALRKRKPHPLEPGKPGCTVPSVLGYDLRPI